MWEESPRQLLQPQSDQLGAISPFAAVLQGRCDGIGGLVAGIAEVGQCRDGIGNRDGGHALAEFLKSLDDPKAVKAYPDFRHALGTQYVCDAILESAKTKQWVKVKKA